MIDFRGFQNRKKFGDILFHFQDIGKRFVYRFFNSAHFFMFNFLIFMLLKVCVTMEFECIEFLIPSTIQKYLQN